ncbi:MAG: hypothetical protein WC814_02510 [Candidatus Paceibacterota bacterium]|jgi:hypothetical protein
MKKFIATAGALALALGGFPVALVHAERGSDDANVQVTAVTAVRVSDDATDDDTDDGDKTVSVTAQIDNDSDDSDATSTDVSAISGKQRSEEEKKLREARREEVKLALETLKESIRFELEDDEDRASSIAELKQKIEERRQELDDEEASTTPRFKDVMKNANEVRLAVHTLLASKDLLGGIGQQVSEIAKQMNDSVATTTNAEAQIESRGFLSKIFFGGDKRAAEAISKEAKRNQESIAKLTELLNEANLSVDIQAALEAQVTALKEAQARFQALAEKEQRTWGIFSWRF